MSNGLDHENSIPICLDVCGLYEWGDGFVNSDRMNVAYMLTNKLRFNLCMEKSREMHNICYM